LAAISKARRVRVLGSRKRLTMVLPCRAGTRLTERWRMALNAAAVAWIWAISARLSSSMVRRCLRVQVLGGAVFSSFAGWELAGIWQALAG